MFLNRKFIIPGLFFLLSPLCANAQWKKMSSPVTKDLYDIQVMGKIGYSVGIGGTFIKSGDSGKTWKSISLPLNYDVRALYFFDTSTGFITGENARIYKTRNGGKTWTQKYIQTATYAYGMAFRGSNGIAVGMNLLALSTTDSGETWKSDTTGKSYVKLKSACITPGGMCWAVGDSCHILKKHISQRRWQVMKYPYNVDLNQVLNLGDSVIIIVGGQPDTAHPGKYFNILIRSTDSGKIFSTTSINEMKTINSAWFRTPDTGFLVGSNGIISKCYQPFTTRGQQLSGTPSILNKVMFDGKTGYIAGDGGTILRTTNNGGFGLSINAPERLQHLHIYPNPGSGMFTLETAVKANKLYIYDEQGRFVKVVLIGEDGVFQVDASGLYFIRAELEDGSVMTGLVRVE